MGFVPLPFTQVGLVRPRRHHPDTTYSREPGTALRQAYIHTLYGARACLFQSYPQNVKVINTQTTRILSFASTSLVSIARARRVIPFECQRLIAHIAFAIHQPGGTTIDHEIDVIDETTLDNDSATDTFEMDNIMATIDVANSRLATQQFSFLFPFSERYKLQQKCVEVKWSNINPASGNTLDIRVNARAQQTGTSNARQYAPFFVAVYADHRA